MRQPSKKHSRRWCATGQEYVPNISHVFRQDQHLYLLYEIYEPAREKPAADAPKGTKPGINLLSSLELIQGSTKVYETPLVRATADQCGGARRGGHRAGCAAGRPQARTLPLPVERDRRRAAAALPFRALRCWCGSRRRHASCCRRGGAIGAASSGRLAGPLFPREPIRAVPASRFAAFAALQQILLR